jgi:hypothetical protein
MMDYAGMAQRLGQFRQAQVPGGGQRPMNGWGQGMMGQMQPNGMPQQAQGAFNGAMNRVQGMFPQQGLFNRPVGQNPAAPGSHMNPQSPVPQYGGFNPRGLVRGGGGGGSFGG